MFPMVSTVDELVEARRDARRRRSTAGRGRARPALRVGIMVEVPAAALKAAAFAPHVDFFSIGTNDLTQYALAAERGNAAVAALADPLDPGVLRLIDAVCRAAGGRLPGRGLRRAGRRRARGAAAGGARRPRAERRPAAVPGVKEAVRRIATAADADLVRRCLSAADPEQVRALLDAGTSQT